LSIDGVHCETRLPFPQALPVMRTSPRTTVASLTGAATALMQHDRTHHRRKVSFTSGARTAPAAILPLDRGRVSRLGDAGSAAPYSCPCLTPGPLRPPRPTPSRNTPQGTRVPRVALPSRVRDDRRCDHASAVVGDGSSRRLCSPRSGIEVAPAPCPVCVPRLAGRGTRLTHAAGQGTLPVTVLGGALPVPCTRNPGYASLNARLRPIPAHTE